MCVSMKQTNRSRWRWRWRNAACVTAIRKENDGKARIVLALSANIKSQCFFQSHHHRLRPYGAVARLRPRLLLQQNVDRSFFLLRHKWFPSVLMLESGASPLHPFLLPLLSSLVFPQNRPSLATQVNQRTEVCSYDGYPVCALARLRYP